MNENIEKFIEKFSESLSKDTFVKLILSNYKGEDTHLQKIMVRLIETKKGLRLFFLYRYDTRDTAKNYDFKEGVALVRQLLGKDFFNGHLFTTENDFQLDIGKKGKARLNIGKPTFKTKPSLSHNREKKSLISPNAFYLKALGITTDKGEIRDKQQDKWKQINKFVEILANVYEQIKGELDKNKLRIIDMGSGKGYLTFASYDYFKNVLGIDVTVTGVDAKAGLVELCNSVAKSCEFDGLEFVHGFIGDYEFDKVDILIALHACNTATDDAIFKAIRSGAKAIVVAPCCHQEIRPQIKPPEMFKNILKHGVMLERTAETITDGLRALLLEKNGYAAKVFEFISVEHTPKNNMIVAIKRQVKNESVKEIDEQIQAIKSFYGIENQRLEKLLETL
ncbi:MAG: SAM-dependent methyltransferase [Acidobacteria bacterium]|jgi:SAM-dependent methyltransferase|nr:MAG: SAM-dependent methyltransferase [Acidobacteriota bacterium]GIU82942.1 MAG: methyltransferase [Pyrinomonadaceae bacterium]